MNRFYVLAALALLASSSVLVNAQDKMENIGQMKFAKVPNIPACLTAAVEQGNPAKGPSTLLIKGTAGCDVPMHFHSAFEQVLMVSGTARLEMKDEKPRSLAPSSYASAAPRHPHHFTCRSACQFYLVSDGPFDVHYVGKDGNEITLLEAINLRRK